jgi:hypothetical protein
VLRKGHIKELCAPYVNVFHQSTDVEKAQLHLQKNKCTPLGRLLFDVKSTGYPEHDIRDRSLYVALGIILAVGVLTRFLYLDQIYLWIDETPYIDGWWHDYGSGFPGFLKGLWKVSLDVYSHFTNNGTWAAVVYGICKSIGTPTLWWARLPAALSSVLLLPVLFILTRLISGSMLAAVIASGVATISITQIYHAQQILEYGPGALIGGLILWSTMAWYDALRTPSTRPCYLPEGFFLFVTVTTGAVLHNSTLPLIIVCFTYLLGCVLGLWNRGQIARSKAILNLGSLLQTGAMIIGCIIVFVLPKYGSGYRGYLAPYYAPLKWEATGGVFFTVAEIVSFGLWRSYDLATYALNPIYNGRWYQPLGLNPLLILPIVIMLVGAVHLWRKGGKGRGFVTLALGSLFTVFLGALFRKYPLGGVRQCLPITVFFYAFVGVGMWVIYQKWKVVVIGFMVLWIAAWVWALPQFYTKRLAPYDTELLVRYAKLGRTSLFVTVNDWGCPEDVIFRYHLRNHSEIKVLPLWKVLEGLRRQQSAFLLASTTTSLDRYKTMFQSGVDPANRDGRAFAELLSEEGLKISPLVETAVNPVKPDKWQYEFLSLYTPLNGLFLYKVEWQ